MKDGTLGIRRRKGMAVKLEQLSVDKDGNIFKVEAGVLPEATHNLARKALNIAACVEDAYADTVKKALAKCNKTERKEIENYIQELYTRCGKKKSVQNHHWIEQSRIKEQQYIKQFPFLQCPPMKEDLLKSEKNLSLIAGHNGRHKDDYNKLLDKLLTDIGDDLSSKYGEDYQTLFAETSDKAQILKKSVNENVQTTIDTLKTAVKKTEGQPDNIMNKAKLYILDE